VIKMTAEIIISRLKTLADDINTVSEEAKRSLIYYYESFEERDDIIRNMYIQDYAPVKTSVPSAFSDHANDRLMIYERFVDGYTRYMDNTLSEYYDLIKRKEDAGKLLTYIMSLPCVCTRVIYYAYVRRMPIDDICSSLYMSRSTFYRYRRTAIELLVSKYNEETVT